jgi:membrane protease YdiL (CAAX protease family)
MLPHPFLNTQRRLRSGWWIAIFFVVLAALLFPLLLLSRGEGASPPVWQQALVVIIASLICQALRRRPLAELTGRPDFSWFERLIIGAGLGAALMLAPATLLWATGQAHFSLNPGGANLLLPPLALFAAVAVTEEVLFRGFIFQRLLNGLGEWPAQVLIAALFLLTHVDAIQNAGPIGYLALTGSDWLTGGVFGLEASIPGLISVITLTAALYLRRRPTK